MDTSDEPIDFQLAHKFLVKCLRVIVCLKNYNYNSESYKKEVVDRYDQLERSLEERVVTENSINARVILDAIRSVQLILTGKGYDETSVSNILREIIRESGFEKNDLPCKKWMLCNECL